MKFAKSNKKLGAQVALFICALSILIGATIFLAGCSNSGITGSISSKPSGFWLATSGQSDVSEEACKAAAEKDNSLVYKSAQEIMNDVAVLRDTANPNYEGVKQEYEGYMSLDNKDNEVHLYTRYGDGDGTKATDWAEFRLIQVGAHQYDTDSGHMDESVLTFFMTHLLPDKYQWNTTDTVKGGWAASNLRNKLQPERLKTEGKTTDGEIYNKFNSNFTQCITPVTKCSQSGTTKRNENNSRSASAKERFDLSEVEYQTTKDAFFLPSMTELVNPAWTGEYGYKDPNSQGATYSWITDRTYAVYGDRKTDSYAKYTNSDFEQIKQDDKDLSYCNDVIFYDYTVRDGKIGLGVSNVDAYLRGSIINVDKQGESTNFVSELCKQGAVTNTTEPNEWNYVSLAFCF